jgi:hypothetical protein
MGDETVLLAVLAVVGVALALGALVLGVRQGLKADAAYADQGFFYPVSLSKFVIMNLLTLEMYTFFWMWKCWRWAKAHGRSDIAPFWRALFGPFWLHPLFTEANSRLKTRALAAWIGVASAAAYFLTGITTNGLSRLPSAPPIITFVGFLTFLFVLPTVIAVNRANAGNDVALKANSKITWLTAGAALAGVLWWRLILFGTSAP